MHEQIRTLITIFPSAINMTAIFAVPLFSTIYCTYCK